MQALFVIELILGLAFVAANRLLTLQDHLSHFSPILDDDEDDDDDTAIHPGAPAAGSPNPG
jgi:hypothetical protein